ncbi:MAG: ThiF family adenylyltransferase [Bryobacteraceae bacterium]|nr:ThiF family adenylyltransferase [Bryobacteraceae bacterium]
MTELDQERYSRQILFDGLGGAGQERLLASHVTIVGCGALGTYQAAALARAGVGTLRIIDRDSIEASNLQRQWLFTEEDARLALPKAIAARDAIGRINSGIRVEAEAVDLTPANAADLLAGTHLLLDGTDNFETRYLLNDYAIAHGLPWIYGAAVGSYGLTMPVIPGRTACLACVYPEPPGGAQETCETVGVLSAITTAVGALQVAAAMKILVGQEPYLGLTTLDVWTGRIRQTAPPQPDPACLCCGQRRFEHLQGQHRKPVSLCGRNAVQIHERKRPLDLVALAQTLAPLGQVRANEFALRFFIAPYEMTIFPDGRAIIKGTQDVALARSLYARYIGG